MFFFSHSWEYGLLAFVLILEFVAFAHCNYRPPSNCHCHLTGKTIISLGKNSLIFLAVLKSLVFRAANIHFKSD
jgi:hypothetical protein